MTLPIKGASLGNPDAAVAKALALGAKKPAELRRYASALWADAAVLGIRADGAFAQADEETGHFTSKRWVEELNPAGISITNDKLDSEAGPSFSPETWARIHITHLAGYAGITPPADWIALDIRWKNLIDAGYFGVANTFQDLDERWAWDGPQQYGDVIESRWRLYDFPSQARWTPPTGGNEGRPDVATKPYSTLIPGIPGGPVPTIAPVKIKLIPEWRTLNRPGIKARTPRRSVQHGNGNPNSSAAAEANYLYNGAGGRQASYHSSTDDKETWIMVPGDEVTWQAADGSGPGNMNGFSNEMVEDAGLWADAGRRMRCIDNTADFMGTIAARLNIAKPEQHWTFNAGSPDRHDCPNKLRHVWINGRLAWDIYEDKWYAAKNAELARMKGGDVPAPTPLPEYAKADPISELEANPVYLKLANGAELIRTDWTVKAIKVTPRLRWATPSAASIGPDIDAGTTFAVSYLIINADGSRYFYTPWHTRVAFDDVEVIGAAQAA